MNAEPIKIERDVADYMATGANATILAKMVERWWAERGYVVKTEVKKIGKEWVVRSDLLNGAPKARITNCKPPGSVHPAAMAVALIPMPKVL